MHSEWSGSGANVWDLAACPASIRMCRGLYKTSGDAARIGTAVHSLIEFCLKLGLNAYECVGLTFDGITMKETHAESAELCLSYIRRIITEYSVEPMVEQKVQIYGTEAYGTLDYGFVLDIKGELLVIDYKNGFALVDHIDNFQLKFYAVAALDTFDLWLQVSKVKTVIIQPNADHVEGSIRTHEYNIDAMKQAKTRFIKSIEASKNPNEKPHAGLHCKYCLAAGNCKARIMRTLSLVYQDEPLDTLNLEGLKVIYDELPVINKHLEAIENKVLSLAKAGAIIEGYKLVKARARAVCKNEEAFIKSVKEKGKSTEGLYLKPKLVGASVAKKKVGADLVNEYYTTPPTSTTLVKLTDSRPAVSNSVIGVFDEVVIR